MKCFILTRGEKRLRSYRLASDLKLNWFLVCDNDEQSSKIMKEHNIPSRRIISLDGEDVPGPPTGAAFKRDFVSRHIADIGKWMIWLDDNVEHLTGLRRSLTKSKVSIGDKLVNWRTEFSRIISSRIIRRYINETIEKAEELNTINCGFATEDNFFFRANKWQFFGYCRSQFTIFKNDGSAWMPIKEMMFEDMFKTVDVVTRYGCVVVNRHLKPVKPFFEEGGIGSLSSRIPHLTHNCKWMMDHYPGLLSFSKGRKYHITFRKRSFNTVNTWRKLNGYL